MEKKHLISSEVIDWTIIAELLKNNSKLELSKEAADNLLKLRDYLDKRMAEGEDTLYGINTGFGSLCDEVISTSDLGLLQKNLVMSHACGVGEMIPKEIIKLMMLLKIQSLSYGNSGVQVLTVQRLIDFYNKDIIPIIYHTDHSGHRAIWPRWHI